jgi:hypothetical protein
VPRRKEEKENGEQVLCNITQMNIMIELIKPSDIGRISCGAFQFIWNYLLMIHLLYRYLFSEQEQLNKSSIVDA